jgi:hypothetical protein
MYRDKIEIKEYIVKNLNIASYLYASGIQFTGATKVNQEFFFHFAPKKRAEEYVERYFLGEAQVNPKELFARLHDLRDLIFNQNQ